MCLLQNSSVPVSDKLLTLADSGCVPQSRCTRPLMLCSVRFVDDSEVFLDTSSVLS